jgi:hypothetical protein
LVLAEVVEDLHYLTGLHYLLESMDEGVNRKKIKEVRLSSKVHLEKAERPPLGEAFTVHTQNGLRPTA